AVLRRRLHAVARGRRSRAPLDPLSAPSRSVEGIGEVLSLVRHLSIPELHDAHGVGALPFVSNHILGNPEIALPHDSPDPKPGWPTRVMATKRLQVMTTVDDLARLWVLTDSIIVIDLMLGDLIARSRCSPMSINGDPKVLLFHHRPPFESASYDTEA